MENLYTHLIQRIGKRLFGETPAVTIEVPKHTEEEIPRYPPFMKGLPAAPVERILVSQAELIQAIEQALALPDELYQSVVLPVIARYAAFSHLLPASESHHHRGAGGLFRHGLEVAHWATLSSQGCLFATHATPRERKTLELRWRLAVCFAGLLHDIGKPVSDIAVIDRQGQYTWNPCDENLTDWAERYQIDRYFLRWRENRHKRHEQFSALVIERVLTKASRSYILEPGPDIMQVMLETIHGLNRGAKLSELVIAADCQSVERDLKAHYHSHDSALGMPVEKYLFDAMRRLVKSGQWQVNEKGARLWRFQEGIHIVWRMGAQDIVAILTKDKVPGIPRDEDTLADILIERGFAIAKVASDGRQYRYWRMQPDGFDVGLYMLRLASLELIFSNEPPVAINAIELADSAEADTTIASDELHQNPTAIDHPNAEEWDVNQTIIDDTLTAQSSVMTMEETAISPSNADVQVIAETDETSSQKPSGNSETLIAHHETINIATDDSNSSQTLTIAWLREQGQAGEWLIQIADKLNRGEWQMDVEVVARQTQFLLAFPGVPENLQVEPAAFIQVIEAKGWLVIDVLSPMLKVQRVGQIRGLLLAAEPSNRLQILLTPINTTSQATQAAKPKKTNKTTRSQTKPESPKQKQSSQDNSAPQQQSTDSISPVNHPPSKVDAKLAYPEAISAWLQHVRSANTTVKPQPGQTDETWYFVSDDELSAYLEQYPQLKRYDFLRDIGSLKECQVIGRGKGVKVRIEP
ncbi:TraI domain-containing protein [Methylomonas sp. EFPC3]|uniref:MobH family relaxase n=1 Tax=Methylomonas sp. EFPC3 TaxID=3021710 RepID=UPI002417ECDD|nr:MobH family relaxase [Methylomonas sp. EFPC3]WFP50410.1 TraI domain-containing protein [Methylomonas sp. EFPC3]